MGPKVKGIYVTFKKLKKTVIPNAPHLPNGQVLKTDLVLFRARCIPRHEEVRNATHLPNIQVTTYRPTVVQSTLYFPP